eukprot:CAMPEP_0197417116 /NCGR_PEP_ID=MMETSP1170-20131217/3255_1 /TAXON_ID=54406 /ORGANISM="Sarcinochrysis sp, Strain CCMP770" /LENGTH=52 /DNA_ID=CAMNT_0042944059 /DNA_START=501 /DNA_END=656 /DNA_ORIENTATION=+
MIALLVLAKVEKIDRAATGQTTQAMTKEKRMVILLDRSTLLWELPGLFFTTD